MKKFLTPKFILLALVYLAAGIFFWVRPVACQSHSNASRPMPQATLVSLNQKQTEKKTLGGKCPQSQCVILFMAPWCPRCEEIKKIIPELKAKLDEKSIPLSVVVGFEESKSKSIAFVKDLPVTAYYDPTDGFFRDLGVDGVPYAVAYDNTGKITADFYGSVEDVKKILKLLGLR